MAKKEYTERNKEKTNNRCPDCGKLIKPTSRHCRNHSQKGKEHPNYGKKHPELSERMKGKNNPMYGKYREQNSAWKGGVTLFHNKIRKLLLYKEWRKRVYARDYWTCQICKIKGGRIHAHHDINIIKIIEFFNIKTLKQAEQCELLWNVNNGITLCIKCHGKLHKTPHFERRAKGG